jgi:histidine triad (HIT) family protein
MTLSKEQISQLKNQLFEQVKHLPENQRKEAESQIEEMSDEAIQQMLESQKEQIKVFREIISGKIHSKKILENEEAIAVLEIKPLSKGHSIIIPKNKIENIDKIPEKINDFSKKIAETLSKKLNSKNIKIIPEKKFGEVIINIIPLYDKEINLDGERSNPSEEDLNTLLEKIKKVEEKVEKKEEPRQEVKKLNRRIP